MESGPLTATSEQFAPSNISLSVPEPVWHNIPATPMSTQNLLLFLQASHSFSTDARYSISAWLFRVSFYSIPQYTTSGLIYSSFQIQFWRDK